MPKHKTIHILYDKLPEARGWKPGHSYRVKGVLMQTSKDVDGADFEIVDVTSLEEASQEGRRSFYLTGDGHMPKVK